MALRLRWVLISFPIPKDFDGGSPVWTHLVFLFLQASQLCRVRILAIISLACVFVALLWQLARLADIFQG